MKTLLAILLFATCAYAQGGMMPGPGTPHTVGGCSVGVDISNGWCEIAHTIKATTSTGTTTDAVTTTGADLIVLVVSSTCNNHIMVVGDITDSKSNSWTSIGSLCDGSGGQGLLMVYTKPTTVGSGHTFTVSSGGNNTYPVLSAYAVSGSHATPLDQITSGTSGASNVTSLASGSITPSQNNELVISGWVVQVPNTGTPTINASMTIADFQNGDGVNFQTGGLAYVTQSTAAAINPTWSWVVLGTSYVAIASFKHS